jgi:outer membrane protein assembly factor BamA
VCLRTRAATLQRQVHERAAATLALTDAAGPREGERSELRSILHEELDRLSERFRAPIVLCDLQDLAYEEAARLLGCPVGTVKSRLARGRERLRARLARRGFAPSSGILVVPGVRASVPTTLREATAHAAIRFSMYATPALGTGSAAAVALTDGMLKSMIELRLKVAAVLLTLTGLGTTAYWVRASSQPVTQPKLARTHSTNFNQGQISKIEIEGNATIPVEKIKPKLLSRVGTPLDWVTVETDLKTLMGTKWFSDVRYYLEEPSPKSGKYALIFVVQELPLLKKVEFPGRKSIRLKEIEDTTGLKIGNRANPTRTRLAVAQIRRLYQEKGYDLASVTLLEGGNPGDTKIVIEIFEGPKVKVNSIEFVGNHFATSAVLRTKLGAHNPIPGISGKYHSDTLDEDRRKIVDYYYASGFFEIKVTPVTRPGAIPRQVDLTFVISEGRQYKVRNVIAEGNTKIKIEKLIEDLELHAGKPFMMDVREADKKRMLSKYGAIGYIDAQIACELRFTNQLGIVDLVYKIVERDPFMLDELRIQGNGRTKDKVICREAVTAGPRP